MRKKTSHSCYFWRTYLASGFSLWVVCEECEMLLDFLKFTLLMTCEKQSEQEWSELIKIREFVISIRFHEAKQKTGNELCFWMKQKLKMSNYELTW